MFDYQHPSVRFTGRWAQYCKTMTATAPGSYLEIAFTGDWIRLHFDISENEHPRPHLWLQLDNGCKTEAPVDRWLRMECPMGEHTLKVIFKGGKELQSRFTPPLVGKVSFLGYEADGAGALTPDHRKTVEFVGDSITEGVLIDDHLALPDIDERENRQYQDDVTAGYAWLTAEKLNLRPIFMGYGAVGVSKSGNGGVPKAAEAYPWCFAGAPITHRPDYIVINHGTNDRGNGPVRFVEEYGKLLDVICALQPQATIFCLSPFCGAYARELKTLVEEYQQKSQRDIRYICGANWICPDPIHPRREAHRIAAEHLTEQIRTNLPER